MLDEYMLKLNDEQLCGIKTRYWREFLKAFQESTTDHEIRTALERLKRKAQAAADTPSAKAQSAIAIIVELERLLDLGD
jgi:hypothetical protein